MLDFGSAGTALAADHASLNENNSWVNGAPCSLGVTGSANAANRVITLPDYNNCFKFFLNNISIESWKRRLIQTHLKPFPLIFIPQIYESIYQEARRPLIHARIKGVAVAHIALLFIVISSVTVLSFFRERNTDSTIIYLQLSYVIWGALFIWFAQIEYLEPWYEASAYWVLSIDYVLLESILVMDQYSHTFKIDANEVIVFTLFLAGLFVHHSVFAPSRTASICWPHIICIMCSIAELMLTLLAPQGYSIMEKSTLTLRAIAISLCVLLCFAERYYVDLLERFESFYYVRTHPNTKLSVHSSLLPLSRGEAVIRALVEARDSILAAMHTGVTESLGTCDLLLLEAIDVLSYGPTIFEAEDYLTANVFKAFEDIMEKAVFSRRREHTEKEFAGTKPETLSEAYVNITETQQQTRRASMVILESGEGLSRFNSAVFTETADFPHSSLSKTKSFPTLIPDQPTCTHDINDIDTREHPANIDRPSWSSASPSTLIDKELQAPDFFLDSENDTKQLRKRRKTVAITSPVTFIPIRRKATALSTATLNVAAQERRIFTDTERHNDITSSKTRLTCRDVVLLLDEIDTDCKSKIGYDMTLDLVSLNNHRYYNNHPMVVLGTQLLTKYANQISVSVSRLVRFLSRIEQMYLPNPYHNSVHGLAVAHQGLIFLRDCGLTKECPGFGNVEVVAFLAACLGHDAGHPGVNFSWLKATRDPLTVIYSDKSPLEQMHAALTLSLFDNVGTNLFFNVATEDVQPLRKHIVELILATDVTFSSQHVTNFRVRLSDPRFFPPNNNSDAWRTALMCIKAGDLGHGVLPLSQHISWSLRVVEEFYQQGEAEALRGIPVTGGFNRLHHKNQFVQSQAFFLICFARPVFACIKDAAGDSKECQWYRDFEENVQYWVHGEAHTKDFPIPSDILNTHTFNDAAIQPILNLELALIRKAKREGYTRVIIPGLHEFLTSKDDNDKPYNHLVSFDFSDFEESDVDYGPPILAKRSTSSLMKDYVSKQRYRNASLNLGRLGLVHRCTNDGDNDSTGSQDYNVNKSRRVSLIESSLYPLAYGGNFNLRKRISDRAHQRSRTTRPPPRVQSASGRLNSMISNKHHNHENFNHDMMKR